MPAQQRLQATPTRVAERLNVRQEDGMGHQAILIHGHIEGVWWRMVACKVSFHVLCVCQNVHVFGAAESKVDAVGFASNGRGVACGEGC